ncbi:extracellular solute-binding protein [Desulforegula conservatrix]|uniref:extracellular solute-binding protein n=1 Tax=Desulforegula conservatrix TaxID=153026 RepID=UPI00040627CE|nr:extracellular solute-binding protein [Desulforegula conservatrix]
MKKFIILCISLLWAASAYSAETHTTHALSLGNPPKYPSDFKHFDYVNPDAPKAGHYRAEANGTFDSFNPFIIKGAAAAGVDLLFDTLTESADDEVFARYGLIAEKMEMPSDKSWIIFHINPKARFSDGTQITAEDVEFTFKLLVSKGAPMYKQYYRDVVKAETLDEKRIKFSFKDGKNPELPLILGQLTVLPKHFWESRDFSKGGLEIPVGSGPYLIDKFIPGKSVTYKRNPEYWAKDHPACKGRYNFEKISYEYFRDDTVSLEAFKAGKYDFITESSAKNWATQYTGKFFDNGVIKKELIPHEMPQGMQGFVFNTRRDFFSDRKVREALTQALDFEWSNKALFYGQYKRSSSYFSNSELASSGLPSEEELKLLSPFRDELPDDLFSKPFKLPVSGDRDKLRENLKKADKLLNEAGFIVKDMKRINKETDQPFRFEILIHQKNFERVCLPFKRNLERLGIKVSIRLVDTAQYINRVNSFDFDMIVGGIGQSLSPGNEQLEFWHSSAADSPGSRNMAGIKNPAVDSIVEKLITAKDRKTLITTCQALDRVLLWNYYMIPQWHLPAIRVAYVDKFERKEPLPKYNSVSIMNWWINEEKENRINSLLKR